MPDHSATSAPPAGRDCVSTPVPTSWNDLQIVRRIRAMNTHIDLYAMQPHFAALLAEAVRVFHDVEARFTRFARTSELSRFNARPAARFDVSPAFLDLLRLALDMHIRTGGVFDPAILRDLTAAGYDRSFEHVARDASSAAIAPDFADAPDESIAIEGMMVAAPVGLAIDFGGIGKGYAVDLAGARLRSAGDYLISAGGDIRASGNGPGGDGWLVSVAACPGDAPLSVIRLHDQAVATSTTAVRNWQRAGAKLHHIIDPRTHRPAASGVTAVSVIASTAVEADVFAKTALILGVDEGLVFLDAQQTPGFFVRDDASCAQSADWPGSPVGK